MLIDALYLSVPCAQVRYCSYLTKEALKNDLVGKTPVKIDIGAVYNAPPNMHASIANFAPVHKELVFDIDMTDYDDIRTCCSGAAVCDKCWVLMSAAIKVVHSVLTRDFGFEHIFWVFSGRRGVHWSDTGADAQWTHKCTARTRRRVVAVRIIRP